MRWKIPEEDRLYDFSRSHWQLKLERLGHEYMDIFMHAHLTKKYESQGSLSAYQISEQAWTDRGGVRWEGQFHAYRLHLGFSYEDRRLKTSTGEVKARDHSPYVWTYLPINNQHWLWAGYEVTYHKGEGPKALRSSLDQNEAYEHRLNWVWEWKPRRSLYLRLLATFDLDHFSKSDAWEGGAGQFMAEF